MRCTNCGCNNPDDAVVCGNCGVGLNNTVNYDVDGNADTDTKVKNKNSKTVIAIISAIVAVLAVIIAIVAVFVSKSNAVKVSEDEINNALASKNGASVISVYDQYCVNSSEHKDSEIAAVNNITYNFIFDAKEFMNGIKEADISNLGKILTENYGTIFIAEDTGNTLMHYKNSNTYIGSVVDSFYELYDSKCSFIDGCEYMDKAISEDSVDYYSKAQESFYKVIESDNLYDLSNDKIYECNDLINDYEKQQEAAKKLKKIDEYLNNNDIKGAENYISSIEEELNGDAVEYLEKAKLSKARSYLKSAETALKDGSREAAYNYAEMAVTLCPDDKEIQEKLEYYEQFLPLILYEENNVIQDKVFDGGAIVYDTRETSNNGKDMYNSIEVINTYRGDNNGLLCSSNYSLSKNYNKVTGTGFLEKYNKNDNPDAYFIIYGDGKKLYTSKKINSGVLPFDFEVDVTDVTTLTIEYYADEYCYPTISYGINNFVALKNIPKN